MNYIKPNTLVILNLTSDMSDYISYYEQLLGVPNNKGSESLVLCLGEIVNMRGHYIFVSKAGKIIFGIHPDCFRLPTEDEI